MLIEPTQFDAAILDLDGTMVDTLGDFEVAVNRTLVDMALPMVARGFIEISIGKGTEHLLRSVLAKVGADAALYDLVLANYLAQYAAINGQRSSVFGGVVEGLVKMQAAGWRLSCLSNKPTALARPLLKSKGLDDYFAFAYGGDSFPQRKPHPMPLLEACKAMGVAPQRTLMVGDSGNDARAARTAGCKVALVDYGYNHGRDVQHERPDWILSRLDDLFAA